MNKMVRDRTIRIEAGIVASRSFHCSLIIYQKILGRYGSTTYSPDSEKLGIFTSLTRQAKSQVSNLASSDLGTEMKLSKRQRKSLVRGFGVPNSWSILLDFKDRNNTSRIGSYNVTLYSSGVLLKNRVTRMEGKKEWEAKC